MKNKLKFLLPSIADILFLSIFLTLALTLGQGLLGDGDTGYHVRAGEFILDTFTIPKHDIFSYLSPPLPWTAHEWLSEVIMALVHKFSGLTGIVIFFSLVVASVYCLLFKIVQGYKGNIILAALVVCLVVASSLLHWLARPHVFSWGLMLLWYFLLDTYQYRHKNYLYLLPPTMLVWVNLHGGYMSGFIFLGVYLVGNLISLAISAKEEREQWVEKIKLLGLTTFVCLLVALINPYGYKTLFFPFRLVSDQFLMDNVQEYLSPNFHGRMPFRYLFFLTIAVFAISRSSLNAIELILIILFTHMSLYSARYIPLFAIVVAPILLRQIEEILERANGRWIDFFRARSNSIALTDSYSKGSLWPLTGILVVFILAANGMIHFKFDEKIKPVAAVEFLKEEKIEGNMFNNDEFGDYLIYAAWPQYKVFFDGRSDMYGSTRIKEYLKITRLEPGWEKIIEKYNISWIFYDANSALSTFLMERKDWKLIYADKVANIFVKNTPRNQPIIRRYPDVKPVIEEEKSESSQ